MGRPGGRDGEEGYRGTVAVCGKSVHIIRCNRKEEISVGTRWRGRLGVATTGVMREILSARCDEDTQRRTYEDCREEDRREDRRATQRQIWGLEIWIRSGREGGSSDIPFRVLAEWSSVCEPRMWTLRVRLFRMASDIKLLRRRSRFRLTHEDCLDRVLI